MKSMKASRTALAARAIAARLEKQPVVYLYARTPRAELVLFRIHHCLNRYFGSYCFSTVAGDPKITVTKNRE